MSEVPNEFKPQEWVEYHVHRITSELVPSKCHVMVMNQLVNAVQEAHGWVNQTQREQGPHLSTELQSTLFYLHNLIDLTLFDIRGNYYPQVKMMDSLIWSHVVAGKDLKIEDKDIEALEGICNRVFSNQREIHVGVVDLLNELSNVAKGVKA